MSIDETLDVDARAPPIRPRRARQSPPSREKPPDAPPRVPHGSESLDALLSISLLAASPPIARARRPPRRRRGRGVAVLALVLALVLVLDPPSAASRVRPVLALAPRVAIREPTPVPARGPPRDRRR
eukprot:30903-Pelagococcus_subviridis.AAC.1